MLLLWELIDYTKYFGANDLKFSVTFDFQILKIRPFPAFYRLLSFLLYSELSFTHKFNLDFGFTELRTLSLLYTVVF